MNLFDLHSNPEQLAHYNEQIKVPFIAYNKTMQAIYADEDYEDYRQYIQYFKDDPKLAMRYAEELNGRFIEGEPAIATNPILAYEYALYTLVGDRFPEGEPAIMKNPEYAYKYAVDIMSNERWKEAEPYIQQDPKWWQKYKNYFRNEF